MAEKKRDKRGSKRGTDTKLKPVRWEYDLLIKDFIPRNYPRPVPPTGILDDNTYCLKFNERWLPHILGALQILLESDSWSGGDDEVFRAQQSIYAMLEELKNPCGDEPCANGDCVAYFPSNPVFTYAPNNPFDTCDTPPAGYLTCPLRSGLSSPVPGLLPDDVICAIDTVLPAPPLGFIDQILNSGFPRVHMDFNGAGEVEIHLLTVPQGGFAIVRIDDHAIVSVVDTAALSVSDVGLSMSTIIELITGITDWDFVPETIVEFNVPSGPHTLDILFIPNLSFVIWENGWGGGLRKVVLCGEFDVPACPDTIIDPIFGGGSMANTFDLCWFTEPDGSKILRYTLNGGCTWADVQDCSDSPPITTDPTDPTDTTEPVDFPGNAPDPKPGEACRITEIAFDHAFSDADSSKLFNSFWQFVVYAAATTADIPGLVLNFLVNFGDPTYANVYSYFDAFNQLALKYFPHKSGIWDNWESLLWGDRVRCIVYKNLVGQTSITRALLNTIASEIEAITLPGGTSDLHYLLEMWADYFRIYPLSDLRRRAYIASYSSTSVDCSDCDEPPAPDCDNMLIQFESLSEPYNLLLGIHDFGRTGTGIKSVICPTNLFPNPNNYPLAVGLTIEFFPPSACPISEFAFRYLNKVGNPEPNANNNLIDVWWNLAIWNGTTQTFSQTFNNKGIYYYNLATAWPRLSKKFATPVVGDKLVLSTWQYATSVTRILKQYVDDVEIIMATS